MPAAAVPTAVADASNFPQIRRPDIETYGTKNASHRIIDRSLSIAPSAPWA